MSGSAFQTRGPVAGALLALVLLLTFSREACTQVQSLEPRLLTPTPVGMNFLSLGYVYSTGDVLESSSSVEAATARLHSATAVYTRSTNFFGRAGRLTMVVPFVNGNWSATVTEADTSTTQTGFGDAIVSVGVGLGGAPARWAKDMATHRPGTMVGTGLRITLPIGKYDSSRAINLGANRWQFVFGASVMRYVGRWGFDAQVRATFITTNSDFYGGNTIGQEPLIGFQLHAEDTFKRGLWVAASFGQGFGGASIVNGETQDDAEINNRYALTAAYPLGKYWALKGAYSGGLTTRFGWDLTSVALSLQRRWGGES